MSGFDGLDAGLPGYTERQAVPSSGASQIPGQSGFDALDQSVKAQVTPPPASDPTPTGNIDDYFKGSTLQLGPFDTGIHIPDSVGKGLAQLGSGFADLPLRGRQVVGAATSKDVDEKRRLDDPLNKGIAGTINSLAGQALPFTVAPEMKVLDAAGAAAPVVKAVATGALQGAAAPVGTGEYTLGNMATAALPSAAIPGVGAVGKSLLTSTTPLAADLAKTAIQKYGIPLGIGDVSQNRIVNALGSFLGQTGLGAGATEAKQTAFNKANMATFGEHTGADKLTPDVIAANKKRIGADFDTVWNNNDLHVTPQLLGDFDALRAKAQRNPSGPAADIDAHLADMYTKVARDPTTGAIIPHPQSGLPYIPGDIANNFQSEMWTLNPKSKSDELVNELRGHILNNFNSAVSPQDAALLNQARGQYRALKTLNPVAVGNENMVAGRQPGDIAPAQLASAVTKAYPNSNSPFGDLPKIGQTLINKAVPETGGSPKALLQGLAMFGLGGGGGAALGQLMGVGPIVGGAAASGLLTGAGVGASKLLKSPGLYQNLTGINAKAAKPGIINAVKQLAGREALRLPAAGALAMTAAGRQRDQEAAALDAGSPAPDTDTP